MYKTDLAKLAAIPGPRFGYTKEEVRGQLGIGFWSLDRLIREGKLKVFYVGRSVRITAESLHALKTKLSG